MSWKEIELEEIVEFYNNKRIPLSGIERSNKQGSFPYYGAQGVIDYIDNYIFDGNYILVAEDGENLRSRNQDIARFAIGKFWVNNHAHIIKAKEGKTLDFFIKSYLNWADIGAYITGAAQPKLSMKNFKQIKINLPPLPTQQKIASILSAYDDLIENNLKRIKLLEEAAQRIYKEWFVDFKFPDHQNTPINPEIGLPEGWGNVHLVDIANLIMGQSPKSIYYNNDSKGLPFHQGVSNYGFRYVENKTFCTKETRIAEDGDILFSVRAPVGRLNIASKKLIIGRGLCALKSKSNFQSFLFYQLKHTFFQEDMIGGGAIFNSVTKKDLENFKLIEPDNILKRKFEKIANKIDQKIKNLTFQNQNLKEARDLLLPRLMNRTIEV